MRAQAASTSGSGASATSRSTTWLTLSSTPPVGREMITRPFTMGSLNRFWTIASMAIQVPSRRRLR
jgi:hypothetical protein